MRRPRRGPCSWTATVSIRPIWSRKLVGHWIDGGLRRGSIPPKPIATTNRLAAAGSPVRGFYRTDQLGRPRQEKSRRCRATSRLPVAARRGGHCVSLPRAQSLLQGPRQLDRFSARSRVDYEPAGPARHGVTTFRPRPAGRGLSIEGPYVFSRWRRCVLRACSALALASVAFLFGLSILWENLGRRKIGSRLSLAGWSA